MAARRTTLNIDHGKVAEVKRILGTDNVTGTVDRALDEIIRRFHVDQLLDWNFGGLTNGDVEREESDRA